MKKMNGKNLFFFALIVLLPGFMVSSKRPNRDNSKRIEIRGIYGSPEPFWKKNIKLNDLGVNAAFIHDGSITDSIMKRARIEGLSVFA